MYALLLRHAEAHAASVAGSDEDRELSPLGVLQAQYIAQRLAEPAAAAWRPARVLVGIAERSRHTGAIIAEALHIPLTTVAELHPDATAQGLIGLMSVTLQGGRPTMLVGHNPNLGTLLELIAPGAAPVNTAELVVVDRAGRIVARLRRPDIVAERA